MAYIDSEIKVPEVKCWYPLTIVYDPIKNGSIDGTDVEPHDAGIVRALNSRYKSNYKAKGNPEHTIFVGRLSLDTTEDDLEKEFCHFGKMIALRLVKDIVTGLSKRYAFIEYETFEMALNAYIRCRSLLLKNTEIFVDFECGRLLPGWKPRRLGGGFGGDKQSGQLRFGGKMRSFRQPLNLITYRQSKTNTEELQPKKHLDFRKSTKHKKENTKLSVSSKPLTSTTVSHLNSNLSTTYTSSIISLPLTPPSQSTIVLPLTPPSNLNVVLPSTPPSNPIIVLPLTPPLNSTVTLPLTPPPQSTAPLLLTPPPNLTASLPLTPPSNSNAPPNFI